VRMRRIAIGRWARRPLLVLLGVTLLLGVSGLANLGSPGTGGSADAATTNSGTLTIGIGGQVVKADFLTTTDTWGLSVFTGTVAEGLTKLQKDKNGNLEWVPLLADSWSQIGPNSWQFVLHKGVKFSDGRPFTSADVVYSVGELHKPGVTPLSGIANLASATAIDPYTVDIISTTPDPFLYRATANLAIQPAGWGQDPRVNSTLIGTGPYKLTSYSQGTDVIGMTRNSDYWGNDSKAFKNLVFRVIPDQGAEVAALKTGEIDVALGLDPTLAEAAPVVLRTNGTGMEYIRLANSPGLATDDLRVRQALNLAINRKELIKNVRKGFATAPQGQIATASSFGFASQIKDYPFDPKQARKLLKQAHAVGANISLVCPASIFGQFALDTCQLVAQMWTNVGFKVNYVTDSTTDYTKLYFARENKIAPVAALYHQLTDTTGTSIPVLLNFECDDQRGANMFCDPQISDEVHAASNMTNLKQRKAAIIKINTQLHQQAAIVPLTVPDVVVATVKGVKGPFLSGPGGSTLGLWVDWTRNG
jgi:peptide/nickel transport system substrate-binding protein